MDSTKSVGSVWSRGMMAVIAAQFLSAMADNALLFGALALLRIDHYPRLDRPLAAGVLCRGVHQSWRPLPVRSRMRCPRAA